MPRKLFFATKHSSKRKQTADTSDRKRPKFCKMVTFSGIPYHNQMDVLKKLDFKDFVNFKQCSKETVEMAKSFRYRLPFYAHEINLHENCIRVDIKYIKNAEYDSFKNEPVRFETEELMVYSTISNGIQIEDFVRKFVTRAENLTFSADERIYSETLINLIKISKATSLTISNLTDFSNLTKQPEIGKLKAIKVCHAEMEESDFLQLETTKIEIHYIHGLKLSTINKFLKQWVENKRIIEKLTILPIPRERHMEIFEDLDFSFKGTPMNDMRRMEVDYIYSITRKDGKKLFLSLDHYDGQPRILARESDDLFSFLRSEYSWAKF